MLQCCPSQLNEKLPETVLVKSLLKDSFFSLGGTAPADCHADKYAQRHLCFGSAIYTPVVTFTYRG